MKSKIKFLIFLIVLGLFFTTSIKIYYNLDKKADSQNILSFLQKMNVNLKVSQLEKLYASTASENWDAVREITKFIQEVTLAIDDLLVEFQRAGVFNHTGTFSFNDGRFKYLLKMNDPKTITLTAGSSNKTFSNRLIIFKSSNNVKYIELYFDDPSDPASDGAVITWEPAVVDPISYTSGKKIECYTDIPNKVMTCSWTGPIETGGTVELGQIIAKLTSDNKLTLNLLAKTTSSASTTIGSSLGPCDESGTRYFYTLLGVQKYEVPFYSTAAFGLKEDTKSKNIGSCTNTYNYGYFNINANPTATDSTKYFAGSGATAPSSDYPSTSEVDALLTQLLLQPSMQSM
jgi:hypothetical protein